MRLVVVGAGGYIGRHLSSAAARHGIATVELSSGRPGGIDPATGGLPRSFTLDAPADAVVYLSQWPTYNDGGATLGQLWSVNVASALAVAAAAREVGARRFVYASTGNVYAPSFSALGETSPVRRNNAYALSKVHAEEALALMRPNLETVSARLFTVYGPGQSGRLVPNLIRSVLQGDAVTLQGRPERMDDDGLRLSVGYVDDVCECLLRLATIPDPGPVINVAGAQVLSVREIAGLIGSALGKAVKIKQLDQPRAFDLVADVSRLHRHCEPLPTQFDHGIETTCRATMAAIRR